MANAENGDQFALQVLRDICGVMRDLTEHVFHVHMMAEKTQNACTQHIHGFAYSYDWSKVDIGHIVSAKNDLQRRLDEAMKKLERAA